ncbi:MAG: hypothetical protein PWQ32_1624, partial [Thermococcaceae archaeon]|nr:hypothetical protein [Thermococcaceae archaeon]
RVFESVIPSGDHDNHLKEFSKNPNKGYYKHAPVVQKSQPLLFRVQCLDTLHLVKDLNSKKASYIKAVMKNES